jgi:hypothetical protein
MFLLLQELCMDSLLDLFQMQKIRISAGSKVDVSTQSFSLCKPKFSNCCPGCGGTSYKMDWDAIAGAKYEVLKFGFKFDLVATTNDPTYTLIIYLLAITVYCSCD